ncbi:MAG TPA: hypothetical protein VIS77_04310 [Burkholderiales bacterium]
MSRAPVARRFLPALLLALSLALGGAAPASAEDWQFGNLKLRWLDGFRYVPQGDVERFLGPQGEGVVVSAAGFGAKTEAEREPLLARHRAFAETELPRLAFVRGGLELPLARATLSDGSLLYSTGTALALPKDEAGFFLQFLVIGRSGDMAFFTVEGKGAVAAQMARFRPLFDSVKWE